MQIRIDLRYERAKGAANRREHIHSAESEVSKGPCALCAVKNVKWCIAELLGCGPFLDCRVEQRIQQ